MFSGELNYSKYVHISLSARTSVESALTEVMVSLGLNSFYFLKGFEDSAGT